jgi:hypothetical protein
LAGGRGSWLEGYITQLIDSPWFRRRFILKLSAAGIGGDAGDDRDDDSALLRFLSRRVGQFLTIVTIVTIITFKRYYRELYQRVPLNDLLLLWRQFIAVRTRVLEPRKGCVRRWVRGGV